MGFSCAIFQDIESDWARFWAICSTVLLTAWGTCFWHCAILPGFFLLVLTAWTLGVYASHRGWCKITRRRRISPRGSTRPFPLRRRGTSLQRGRSLLFRFCLVVQLVFASGVHICHDSIRVTVPLRHVTSTVINQMLDCSAQFFMLGEPLHGCEPWSQQGVKENSDVLLAQEDNIVVNHSTLTSKPRLKQEDVSTALNFAIGHIFDIEEKAKDKVICARLRQDGQDAVLKYT